MESGVGGQRNGGGGAGGWVLVEARLQGGAPWGFTLQGGLEHGEPLIISKVEEGGKADRLEQPLLVGDELIVINEVELTGYRQEAIALIKGSYKTLQLSVRREFDPGYAEEFATSPFSLPALPPSLSSSTPPPSTPLPSPHSRSCTAGGVQLRIKSRRSEPASRPHSWHSTKLSEGQQGPDKGEMDTVTSAWHHGFHASALTADMSGGFDPGVSYLRRSPDQYSSRGSMESLDHHSSQLHSGAQHLHPHGHQAHSGPHRVYSSCQQLSSARSSNSIDHLHSKRDSAYSSFSTSSSIPEYRASTPSFSSERSYSLETVPQRGGGSGELPLQPDIRYVQTVSDAQTGSQEHELRSDSKGGGGEGPGGGVCYRGSSSGSVPASNRHSVGPIWGPAASCSSYESLRGAPAPPRRSDSYAAIKNHERPNSWSSLEHARSLRTLQKGSWHHSSGHLASGAGKGSYSTDGQLHTVIEKSPESSPTTKPRQSGGFHPPSPPELSPAPTGPGPQSGRLILPTGTYPVLQPEPRYAQMPSSNHGPPSSGVYPALTKQSSQQQHQDLQGIRGRDDGVTEGQRDGRTMQNGCHHNALAAQQQPSYPASSASVPDRSPKEDFSFGHYQPCIKGGGCAEGQTGTLRHHQESLSQSLHDSSIQTGHEHNQDFHVPHIQSTTGASPPPNPDSFTVQSRSVERTSVHSDQAVFSRVTREQPTHQPLHPQPQATPSLGSQTSARHFSDSAALPYQTWDHREQGRDREHPLTRLQNALAEVQRCASPDDGAFSANNKGDSSFDSQPARSLSVLEKVSRFERREQAGKHRSHSTSHIHSKATYQMSEKGRSSPCGADDLRNMLERSTNGTKAQRTMSYRGNSSDLTKYRTPADPSSALQRSRSSFQLEGSKEGDFGWKQDVQEILGSMPGSAYSRDAQPRVLRSTSLRQKDLSSSLSPPPPAASPPLAPSSSHQSPFVPVKQHSLEKKGPKTMPKPQGVIVTPQSSPLVTSPHTPKERHVVSPDVRGPSPPALPSVPPVGPPALIRICGRKRLTADQKKRSYSEPENMNEVGISGTETAALFRRGGETSVADRRKMFELAAASPVGARAPLNATSRPELRQLQHSALSEYVERKRGIKRGDGGHSAPRPHSAYFQPDSRNHTASPSCYSDTYSISSASSMLSLQDSSAEQSLSSGERRLCSTLPPGADFRSLQSNLFYPGRVTTPRPPALPPPSCSSAFLPERQYVTPQTHRGAESVSTDPDLGHQQWTVEPQHSLGLFKQLGGALQRAGSAQSSKKSASAEDLLERFEEKQRSHQHYRSRSSPTTEMLNQDFPPGDVRMCDAFVSLTEDRPADVQVSLRAVCPHPSQTSVNTVQPSGPTLAHTPVARREKQRNCDCQRAHSTSTLAASVGLPCPFSPPGAQDGGGTEWPASDRLSLDAIAFADIQQTSTGGGSKGDAVSSAVYSETLAMDRQTGRSLSGSSILEDKEKDTHRGRAYSLEMRGHSDKQVSATTDAPIRTDTTSSAPSPHSSSCSPIRHLSSLRISESSLLSAFEQQKSLESSSGLSQDGEDDVFLLSPAPPSPPPAVEDTDSENFPTPPPPSPPPTFELEIETGNQTVQSPSTDSSFLIKMSPPRSPPVSPLPVPSLSLSPNPPPVTLTTSTAADVSLCLDYQPLSKRKRTPEELRAELLARQLVQQESSLAPLLATWGSETTVELMEEIFTNSKSQVEQRGSSQLDDRLMIDGGKEASLDEEPKDLNTEKVELCAALRSSVAALQQEKEALCEEQRLHQALGASIEMLVQEHLKTNERDKYNMFIGDLERIVNLLLSLCSRLSRIDRSLLALEAAELTQEDASKEKDSLHHKRSLLLRQTEDARELKENLDRRQQVVHAILTGYLTQSQLQDYRQFVSAKPSLLIRRRHLDDLIRQGEEQLERLAESLPAELAEAAGWSRASPLTRLSPMSCSSPLPQLLPSSMIPGPVHLVRSTTLTSL